MSVEANKALVRRWVEEGINGQNLALLDEWFSPDFVEHAPWGAGSGREATRRGVRAVFDAIPDLQETIVDMVAEGDKVADLTTIRGTQHGEFAGIAATGKPFQMSLIQIRRLQNGKFVEQWGEDDRLDVLQQLA
jgi:predicted ester cyclase